MAVDDLFIHFAFTRWEYYRLKRHVNDCIVEIQKEREKHNIPNDLEALKRCHPRLMRLMDKLLYSGEQLQAIAATANRGTALLTQDAVKTALRSLVDEKYNRDIQSIRSEMELARDTFDRFSKVADMEDEAILRGMNMMLSTFEAEVLRCGLR